MLLIIVFRGWLYRELITYRSIGQRTNYSITNKKLADYITTNTDKQNNTDAKEIIKQALSITSQQLNFTVAKNDNDPNKLINSKTAHCVGYAAFFSTTCNYLLQKNDLAGNWVARPQIGQLYLLGINVHPYFHSSFFKDHDFDIIENKNTGEILAVDPTINDYLHIDFVTFLK